MKCPDCKTKLYCGCATCRENSEAPRPQLIVIENGNYNMDWEEACPVCGRVDSIHVWYERQLEGAAFHSERPAGEQ